MSNGVFEAMEATQIDVRAANVGKNKNTDVITVSIDKKTNKAFLEYCKRGNINRSKLITELIGHWLMVAGTQRN